DESMLAPQRNRESSNDDFISAREGSRECQGYVTASGARAFLALTKKPLEELAALSEYDLETKRHLAGLAADLRGDAVGGAPGDSNGASTQAPASDTDSNASIPAPDAGHLAA